MSNDPVRRVEGPGTTSAAGAATVSGGAVLEGHGAAERRVGRTSAAAPGADGVDLSEEDDEVPAAAENNPLDPVDEVDEKKAELEKKIKDLQDKIENKQAELDDAIAKGDFDTARTLIQEIRGMQDELQTLISPPETAPPASAPAPSGGGAPPAASGGGAPAAAPAAFPNYGGGMPGYGGGMPGYGGGGFPTPSSSPGAGAVPADHVGSDVPLGPPGGGVQKFIDTAKAQQGKPYVFGATGPNSFDCSGLVYYSLKQAGVNAPRLTAAGYQEKYKNSAVGKDQLKPGDLIFYYYPNDRGIPPGKASHIEIYLGNGMSMGTDSPKEGARIEPVNWDAFIGGARVPELYQQP